MAWNDLTISQRSQLMNMFRKNGVASLSEMKRIYDLSSPSLVEATQSPFNPSAPVYAAGGPRKAGYFVYDKNDPDFVGPSKPAGFGQAPVDPEYVKLRQRYAESVFNNAAYNPGSQAKGAYQITPVAEQEYLSSTKKSKGDLYDYAYNEAIRDWYMDKRMPQMPAMHHGHPSDSVKWGIKLASFNAGPGATNSALRKAEEDGADIEGTFDWVPYLPVETQNYVNFILRGKDIPGTSKTQAAMDAQAAKKGIYGCGGKKFDMGGPGSSTGGIVPTLIGVLPALKEKYLTDYANNGIVWDYPNSKKELKKYIKSPYNGKNNRFDNTLYPFYNDAENTRRAAFAKYFNLPEDNLDFTINDYIVESNYKPTISKNPEAKYYTFKNNDIPKMFDWVTGRYSATLGEDEKGKYVALYDDWDLSPFGALNTSNNLLYDAGLNSFEKFGAVPVEFYDRIYENENPKAYHSYVDEDGERRTFLRNYASGGKIHIKPKNRGKFTALKKRTGHSASWFKAHGTPAQKKMAVFALNAAKWNHKKGHGGFNF